MIARLSGILESVEGNIALVSLAPPGVPAMGVAHEVMVPAFTARDLSVAVGRPLTLYTFQYLEQQAQGASFIPRLVGFATLEDRRFFELFTKVKGVGVKKALRAMAVPVAELADAIAAKDLAALKELPEIGKKLAETIVLELKDQVGPFAAAPRPGSATVSREGLAPLTSPAAQNAIAALVRLGDTRNDAEERVRHALKEAGESGQGMTPDELLAAAFSLRS